MPHTIQSNAIQEGSIYKHGGPIVVADNETITLFTHPDSYSGIYTLHVNNELNDSSDFRVDQIVFNQKPGTTSVTGVNSVLVSNGTPNYSISIDGLDVKLTNSTGSETSFYWQYTKYNLFSAM